MCRQSAVLTRRRTSIRSTLPCASKLLQCTMKGQVDKWRNSAAQNAAYYDVPSYATCPLAATQEAPRPSDPRSHYSYIPASASITLCS